MGWSDGTGYATGVKPGLGVAAELGNGNGAGMVLPVATVAPLPAVSVRDVPNAQPSTMTRFPGGMPVAPLCG
jgi:hypothetical protein